jgi:hypothetical protein
LIVGNVFPDTASTHFPLIKSFVADTFTLGSITVVAVAITVPPLTPNPWVPHPVFFRVRVLILFALVAAAIRGGRFSFLPAMRPVATAPPLS